MIKKFFLIFIGLFAFVSFANAENELKIDFFYAKTCTHCGEASKFLDNLALENKNVRVSKYDVSELESVELLQEHYLNYNVDELDRGYVPIMFVGEKYFIGFKKNSTDVSIRAFINGSSLEEVEELKKEIVLPFVGEISIENKSPLFFSVVFGVLDGFNACAMAALAFLLSVLIGIGDRRKLILLGGTFILVSGIVYFLFMAAWLNIFLVLPHLDIITYAVGILMIIMGVCVLKEFFDGVVCKLCEVDAKKSNWFSYNQKKLMEKARNVLSSQKSMFLTIGAVIFIAAGINTIELVCSFGLPVAFTKILTSYDLTPAMHYFYLIVYDIFYMLDDFIVFLIAVFTFNLVQESDKFIRGSKLISGILLLFLGIVMIFFPGVLGQL